ncbi:MAG: hypothetical protein HOP12_07525 [Candidatus Eisenbacteria bacterium]|uniref:Uncharacterized protein n=1 Tax=Eiseniibacteriota bacterium TaxID=2212470 RepID=A0A849SJZ7_UNCEI|nr:hypothetical protein [Candidatus Eisenbacteria bacterium]
MFSSPQQQEHFLSLNQQWGDRYRVFYGLPFGNIFDLAGVEDVAFGSALSSATVPYTLCDESGNAVLCVDFDELGDGVNVGDHYQPVLPTSAPWSRLIRLKLVVAKSSGTPYLVVGSRYFESLSRGTKSSILDAVIGEVMARRATRARLEAFDPEEIGLSVEEFQSLTEDERQERVQDWVIGVEVEADFEHSPIHARIAELEMETNHPAHGSEGLFDPPLPEGSIDERLAAMASAEREGARVWVETQSGERIERVVWLPRFELPNYYGPTLAKEIALLLALEQLVGRQPR